MIKNVPVILIEEVDDSSGEQRGFAVLEQWHVYLFMRMLYVHPKFRGQGVADNLVRRAKVLSADYRGLALVPESWADQPLDNSQLTAWYERCGFLPCKDGEGVLVV